MFSNRKIYSIFVLLNSFLYFTNAGIITNDNMVKRVQTSSPFDETTGKNDDAHLRLYYKSNTPDRSISHEMEHRLVKNPAFQYNQQAGQQQNPFQPKFNTQFDLSYFDPRGNILPLQQNFGFEPNKNRQTLLNLHYHGNALNTMDSSLNQMTQQQLQFQQQLEIENQRKAQRANLLRMLLLNMSPNQQFAMPQPIQPQIEQQQQQDKNDLQYKIVHLKFKIEPQLGRILGQGYVETDNGAGSLLNSGRFSVLPKEIPDIVKRLLVATQPQNQQRTSFIKKREDDDLKSNLSEEANLEKREDIENQESHEETNEPSDKRIKKAVESLSDDDKINDTEFSESFKSLQRRDDSEYSSLAESDNEEKQLLARDDEDNQSSISDSFEIN